LASPDAASEEIVTLRLIGQIAREQQFPLLLDTLLQLCLDRNDVQSKLIASDILARDSLFADALGILNSYSFVGSTDLMKRALLRKAVLYPRAVDGGFRRGLSVCDSLLQIDPQDPMISEFIRHYPLLYCGLKRIRGNQIPKKSLTRVFDRILPEGFGIWPNYPNPFRDVTSFTFKLGKAMHVRLTIHDAMGREVALLADTDYTRGVHSLVLRSAQMPSGLYFARFVTDQGVMQRKMLLLR
ncbi:MAG: T9SS type A sorting domain-containing protein, partial [Bacteroidetes bacterium]|nr:T9SS type A sorting domain-containing protein [Bacteroidota bacterium]